MLGDDAKRRLTHYCRRAATSPPDFVTHHYGGHERRVRSVDRHLRDLVWNDAEVRDALLHADFDTLATQVAAGQALDLLDLFTAMTHEHEQRQPRRARFRRP
jgi:hypothetical protein